jgi:UDP-N-acetylmuramate dehydrogenase
VNISENAALRPYNTFAVEANARIFIQITAEQDLIKLYEQGVFSDRFFILGGGSNVLFTENFDGTIIKIANTGIQHFIEGNYIFVTASAGEVWNDLVWYCIDRGFPGMENLALIPGTVGASPIQNIGAYGTELMDIFYSCRAFDTMTGTFRTFKNEDCSFTYRDSIFKTKYKGRYIILSVTYKLAIHKARNTSYGAIESELEKRGIQDPSIKDVAEVVSHIRVEKLPDPSTIGNAGSFFKNPIVSDSQLETIKREHPDIVYYTVSETQRKLAAGWLIEQCGWKGKEVGEVAIWRNQALVITNKGTASGKDIYNVSSQIIADVQQKFNVELQL